jgi:hypothetical protein
MPSSGGQKRVSVGNGAYLAQALALELDLDQCPKPLHRYGFTSVHTHALGDRSDDASFCVYRVALVCFVCDGSDEPARNN